MDFDSQFWLFLTSKRRNLTHFLILKKGQFLAFFLCLNPYIASVHGDCYKIVTTPADSTKKGQKNAIFFAKNLGNSKVFQSYPQENKWVTLILSSYSQLNILN